MTPSQFSWTLVYRKHPGVSLNLYEIETNGEGVEHTSTTRAKIRIKIQLCLLYNNISK